MRLYFTPFYITAQNKQIFINYQIFFATYLKKVVNRFFYTFSRPSKEPKTSLRVQCKKWLPKSYPSMIRGTRSGQPPRRRE